MGRGSGSRSSAGGGAGATQIGGEGFGGAGANVTSPQRQTQRQRQESRRNSQRTRVTDRDVNQATAGGRAEQAFRDAVRKGDASSVKSAYRKAAVANHPDKGGSEEKMKRINQMYSDWKQSSGGRRRRR